MTLEEIKKRIVSDATLTQRKIDILSIIERLQNNLTINNYVLDFTLNHNEKMEGMQSLSTSPLLNDNCVKISQNDKTICHHCFSIKQLKRFKNQDLKYIYNYLILNYCDLKENQIPFINACYFRIEAFGDLNSMTQLKNYIQIIKSNKHTFFAWFTKRYDLIIKYLEEGGVFPNNCNLILSSPLLNSRINSKLIETIRGYQPNINLKVFSVYDGEKIKDIEYNCLKKCSKCLKCYTKNKITYINEKLK